MLRARCRTLCNKVKNKRTNIVLEFLPVSFQSILFWKLYWDWVRFPIAVLGSLFDSEFVEQADVHPACCAAWCILDAAWFSSGCVISLCIQGWSYHPVTSLISAANCSRFDLSPKQEEKLCSSKKFQDGIWWWKWSRSWKKERKQGDKERVQDAESDTRDLPIVFKVI